MNKRKALEELLSKFGYEVRGTDIWTKRIAGYPGRPFGTCRDIFDACDQLIPIIHDDKYHKALTEITDAP